MTFTLGDRFVLKAGQSAALARGRLSVGMDDVTGDSRCPKGSQCVWAGEATVRLWAQEAGRARQPFELKSSAAASQVPIGSAAYALQLVEVNPYPVGSRRIAAGDYSVTLIVRLSADAPPGTGAAPASDR